MLSSLKQNPTDAWVIQNLLTAGHKILSVTKYPTHSMLNRNGKTSSSLAPSKPETKNSLLSKKNKIDIAIRHRSHHARAVASRDKILAVLQAGPKKLKFIAIEVSMSEAGVKRHLDLLIEEFIVVRNYRTKYYSLV